MFTHMIIHHESDEIFTHVANYLKNGQMEDTHALNENLIILTFSLWNCQKGDTEKLYDYLLSTPFLITVMSQVNFYIMTYKTIAIK